MVGAPPVRSLLHREVRFGPFEQAAEHPHTIDQETAVGRIVTTTLRDTAIHPQAVPAGQVVILSQAQHAIIHLVERLRTHESF